MSPGVMLRRSRASIDSRGLSARSRAYVVCIHSTLGSEDGTCLSLTRSWTPEVRRRAHAGARVVHGSCVPHHDRPACTVAEGQVPWSDRSGSASRSSTGRTTMLIALLAVLGVDLIVIVVVLALVISRKRWV